MFTMKRYPTILVNETRRRTTTKRNTPKQKPLYGPSRPPRQLHPTPLLHAPGPGNLCSPIPSAGNALHFHTLERNPHQPLCPSTQSHLAQRRDAVDVRWMPSAVTGEECDQSQSLTLSLFLGHPPPTLVNSCGVGGWGDRSDVVRHLLGSRHHSGYFP